MAHEVERGVSSTTPSLQPSRLLQLPPEIRDMIWAQSAGINRPHQFYDPTTGRQPIHPLRLTCHFINDEASPRIFNLTNISLDQWETSHQRFFIWLKRIGEVNRLAIHRFRPVYTPGPLFEVDPAGYGARKWAHVLYALPNVRHLTFSNCGDLALMYWRAVIEQERLLSTGFRIRGDTHELRTIAQSCSNLVSWSMERGLATSVMFIIEARSLRALQINLRGNEGWSTITSDGTYRHLEYLHLGYFPDFVWRDLGSEGRSLCKPPEALEPVHLNKLQELYCFHIVRRPSGVNVGVLYDLGIEFGDNNVSDFDTSRFLEACPNLTYLALDCGRNYSLIDHVPDTLKTVALLFDHTVVMEVLKHKLTLLQETCRNLVVVAIFVNLCTKGDWDEKIGQSLEPVLQALETLKQRGVHVTCFARFNWDSEADEQGRMPGWNPGVL